MNDRLQFDRVVLDNGITVLSKRMDVPFAYAYISVPVGTIHNTDGYQNGMAHFLEHMCCNRSSEFPEIDSFSDFICSTGGGRNAMTSWEWTTYLMNVPTTSFERAFRGLTAQVFEPILLEEDLRLERTIISNERKRESHWFPGDTPIEQYNLTRWKKDSPGSVVQIYGTDEDLASMDVGRLQRMQSTYLDPRTFVLLVGNFDIDLVTSILSRYKTSRHELKQKFEQVGWVNREYHEVAISEINRFMYHFGGIGQPFPFVDLVALLVFKRLMVDQSFGAVYRWLRSELGWSYGVGAHTSSGSPIFNSDWELMLPVSSYEQAKTIRKDLPGRINDALRDESRINSVVNMLVGADLFDLQTAESLIKAAKANMVMWGTIANEREWTEARDRCRDPRYLQSVFERYTRPEDVGEFLAIPEKPK